MRSTLRTLAFTVTVASLATSLYGANGKLVTATGWFADEKCARARVQAGTFAATNPECARRCVNEGAKLVFIAEAQKAAWSVALRDEYIAHIGDYVEIAGTLDETSGAMEIDSITTIDHVKSSCAIPHRKQQEGKNAGSAHH